MLIKLLIAIGMLIFTMDHPHLIAFGSVLYLFNEVLEEEEKTYMKNLLQVFASKVSNQLDWVKSLKNETKEVGLDKEEGRTLASQYIASIYTHFTTEELKKIAEDATIQDQVIKSIRTQLDYEDEDLSEWEPGPLTELVNEDFISSHEKEFIEWCAPDFDWTQKYTYSNHRQLFKKMKSLFRNPDGSLNNSLANDAVTKLQDRIHAYFTDSELPSRPCNNREIINLLITKKYKNKDYV